MTAKKTKIQNLTKRNKELEEELKSLYSKLDIAVDRGNRRFHDIDRLMDGIEKCFSQQVTWMELSSNPNNQLRFLTRTIATIRRIVRYKQY